MEKIYPVSALAKDSAEVKKAAKEGVVRITEHGSAAYIFCSESVFQEKLIHVAEQAAYEAKLSFVIDRGLADIEAGRIYDNAQAAFAEIENKRKRRD